MEDEMFKKLSAIFGLDQKKMQEAIFYDVITQTSLDLTALTAYAEKYEVMTPESRARFKEILRTYLQDLRAILHTEADIEALRDSF